jgi:hypothetical protein
MATLGQSRAQQAATVALLAGCIALLAFKFTLALRMNVNWDEFFYLTHIYELQRDEIRRPFQTAYTRLFSWLAEVGNDEVTQVVAGRLIMTALLALTSLLLWKLARRFTGTTAALLAPLGYLSMSYVSQHGGSFRADSLLAPVLVGALVILARQNRPASSDWKAGFMCGLAFVISVKAVLFLPLIVALTAATEAGSGTSRATLKGLVTRLTRIAAAALGTAGFALAVHSVGLTPPESSHGEYASRVLNKTLIDVEFIPQLPWLLQTFESDWALWLLIGIGFLLTLLRRNLQPATCILALLPILFYRNAYPYYYVVVFAPVSIFVSCLAQELQKRSTRLDHIVTVLLAALIATNGVAHLVRLTASTQEAQREVIAAVHKIFPQPVPYIDHSGMIASFPKANFFMSSWGIEDYRMRGEGFVARSLHASNPPLLLINRAVLQPSHPNFNLLLEQDQEALKRSYIPYWGPIWVAGAQTTIPPHGEAIVSLPFSGRYRVEAEQPVTIQGVPYANGGIFEFVGGYESLTLAASTPHEFRARLVWAGAMPPPSSPFSGQSIYEGF